MNEMQLNDMLEAIDPARALTDQVLDELAPERRLMSTIAERVGSAPSESIGAGGRIGGEPSVRSRRSHLAVLAVAGVAACLTAAVVLGIGPSSTTPNAAALTLTGHIVGGQSVKFTNRNGSTLPIVIRAQTINFKAGSRLSVKSSRGFAYLLSVPPSATAMVERLARIFDTVGPPTGKGGKQARLTIGSLHGSLVIYRQDRIYPSFDYWRNNCGNVSGKWAARFGCPVHPWQSPEQVQTPSRLTHALMNEVSAHYVRTLGFGYSIGDPTFSGLERDPAFAVCGHLCGEKDVRYTVFIGGVPSDQMIGFAFNQAGQVTRVDAPAFFVHRTATAYPLLSPAAAVPVLDRSHPFVGEGLVGGFSRCLTPCTPEDGTLNSAKMTLSPYLLQNGTVLALPVYAFSEATLQIPVHGASSAHSEPLPGVWPVLAIEPSDVHYVNALAG
jgi:hypothetical protein